MGSVYFPAQIVVLFRRLVDVISTLSISNQYLFLTRQSARVEEGEAIHATTTQQTRRCSSFPWTMFEWPPWSTFTAWRRQFTVLDSAAMLLGRPSDTLQDTTTLKRNITVYLAYYPSEYVRFSDL
jgi:hypothetical protein